MRPHHRSVAVRGVAAPVLLAAAVGLVGLAAGCGSVRPYLHPLPGAPTDTLGIEASRLILMLEGVLVSEGLRMRVSSPEEGYLETEWFDVERHRPVSGRTTRPHDVIRFRFFADPLSDEETVLVSEVVYRLTTDPSLSEREREVLATGDHPGREMLERVWATVQSLRGGGGG